MRSLRLQSNSAAYILILALFFAGCTKPQVAIFEGMTQGTTYRIVVKGEAQVGLSAQVDSIFAAVDGSMSLFNPSSLLSRINRGETDSLDAYIRDCILTAERVSRESGGMYDITIKPVTTAYGFGGGDVEKEVNLDTLMQFVGYEKISVDGNRLVKEDPRIQIDLNSIAQGYTVDLVARHFDKLGIGEYLVEMGGEIYAKGRNRSGRLWTVGIDKPVEGNNIPGADTQSVISLSGRGLATSGNYRKFYTDDMGRKVVHTIDALTGEPVVSNLLSVTVVAENATLADAYGTFFMAAGMDYTLEFLKNRPDIDVYMVYSDETGDFRTYFTPGIKMAEDR